MKLLLGRDDVDSDKPDLSDHTRLSGAAFYGHEGVVKLLLKRDDVNADKPDIPDECHSSGLLRRRHSRVMESMLGWDDVNPDSQMNGPDTTRGDCLLWGGEIITRKKTALTPKTQMCGAGHYSRGSLVVGTREWSNCYLDGTTSTLINQTKMAKDHSGGPLTMGTKERRDYFSNGRGQP